MTGKNMLTLLAGVGIVLVFGDTAFAGGGDLPWESVLDRILRSLSGPVVRFAAAASIIVFGLLLAVIEMSGIAKRVVSILLGLSIAASAVNLTTDLFGLSNGASF